MMALVRGVIAASTQAGSIVNDSRIDIHEHRSGAGIADRRGGGDERERYSDDFVARLRRRRRARRDASALVPVLTPMAWPRLTIGSKFVSNAATSLPSINCDVLHALHRRPIDFLLDGRVLRLEVYEWNHMLPWLVDF